MIDLWGMSARMCVQSFIALHIKRDLGTFRELIPTTRTTTVAFWTCLPGPKRSTGRKCYARIN